MISIQGKGPQAEHHFLKSTILNRSEVVAWSNTTPVLTNYIVGANPLLYLVVVCSIATAQTKALALATEQDMANKGRHG